MAFTRAELIAAVERSPQAAAAHDRAGWVGLFAAGARVEDPVGSRPHQGTDRIARFFDTFIGPRDITFHRDVDLVEAATVIRDLELEVLMGATVTMRIPAYLRYAVDTSGAELRIAELQAYWELPAMVGEFLRNGPAAGPAGMQLAAGLLRNQGPVGAFGFACGFRRAGSRGRNRFTGLLDALVAGDEVAVRRRLSRDTEIYCGDTAPISTSDLVDHLAGAQWRKPVMSGYSLVAGFRGGDSPAVVIVELVPKSMAVRRLRYYGGAPT